MFIYQIWVKTPTGEIVTKALIAKDRAEALSRAVERAKAAYGPGTRVSYVVPVQDAGDLKRVNHSGLNRLLTELDQLEFLAFSMKGVVRQSIDLAWQLIVLLREVKERTEEGEDYAP